MTYRSLLFAVGLSLAFIAPAFAQNPTNYSRPGIYLGVGGLYAIENFKDTGSLKFDNAPGFNFRLGYRFHPNIAVEAMGERTDDFDLDASGSVDGEVNTWTGTLNGKFFALTERFQPYGLLGIGAMRGKVKASGPGGSASEKDTGGVWRFGGGIDSYFTENVLVNLEFSYVLARGDVSDLNYSSLGGGIQFRF